MQRHSPVTVIVAHENERNFGLQISNMLGYSEAEVVVGTPSDAIPMMAAREDSPRYLIIDIGDAGHEILGEIDILAEYCDALTRVVVIGSANDVNLYRALRSRGVIEYFTRPAKLADIRTALMADFALDKEGMPDKGSVIAFMSAASGDGASTVALNTAYSLASEYGKSVVLVDMDYQFGMVAKNLDLTAPFGIKELFEHPERGIDTTLVERMLVPYGDGKLKIISAPNQLHMIPEVRAETIHDLIRILRRDYDVVVLDLPHIWTPWIASALGKVSHLVMVAQLWLRSVTHSSRLLSAWRAAGVDNERISVVVNRSGAKFKEAVSARDFERVCGTPIRYYFVNDIKNVVAAENQGKTLSESGNSLLSRQFKEFTGFFVKEASSGITEENTKTTSLKLRR